MHYIKKLLARSLRKNQTPEEKIVWEILRNRRFMNLKFRRQHNIEGFIVDFYCCELNLAIEIDGGIHIKQKDYDNFRQEIIESKNVRFIRVSNNIINNDVNLFLEQIRKLL